MASVLNHTSFLTSTRLAFKLRGLLYTRSRFVCDTNQLHSCFYDLEMDSTQTSDRLQDLYLTGVRPNQKDIGVGAYGKVFEVEFGGIICAAKEVHSILVQSVRKEEFDAIKMIFLRNVSEAVLWDIPILLHF